MIQKQHYIGSLGAGQEKTLVIVAQIAMVDATC